MLDFEIADDGKKVVTFKHRHNVGDEVYVMLECDDNDYRVSEPLEVAQLQYVKAENMSFIQYMLMDLEGEELPKLYEEYQVFATEKEAEDFITEYKNIPF